MNRAFPRVFERRKQHAKMLYRRRKMQERMTWERPEPQTRMLDLTRNSIVWQKQPTLFEIYARARYAEKEKKFEYALPGHGRKSSDECGQTYAKGCDHHEVHENNMDFIRLYRHNCRSRACPVCYESWASRAAENVMIRKATYAIGSNVVKDLIYGLKRKMRLESNREYHKQLVLELEKIVNRQITGRSRPLKPVHFILSPPNPTGVKSDRETTKALRNEAYRIAQTRGIHGGCLVPHPYRLRCVACHSTISDYRKECACGSMEFEWFWSFHFHVMGFGWAHDTAEGYDQDGWIVKGLGVRKSVFWTAQYILSHAGVSDLYTVTWFGDLSYRKMANNRPPKVEKLMEICPFCEAPLKIIIYLKGQDRPPPEFDPEHSEINDFLAVPGEWKCH